MSRVLPIAAFFVLLAPVTQAQAPFSCDPAFEARFQSGIMDSELRTWIADTARRFAKTRATLFWQHLPREQYPCVDLSCLSDEQVVAEVAKQCTADPRATLEHAAQNISLFVTSTARPAPLEQRATPVPKRQ
jgi:hypothetical protein